MSEGDDVADLRCAVFIATSLDGCIARGDGALDWLPGADAGAEDDAEDGGDDSGYAAFVATVDVLVMGRTTYDTVLGFGIGWPYTLPVVVLSSRPLDTVPDGADVRHEQGPVDEVAARLAAAGFRRAYVDGGAVVQQFLAADLVDELTITQVPVLLGDGIRLFGQLDDDLWFTPEEPRLLAGGMVQTRWVRDR